MATSTPAGSRGSALAALGALLDRSLGQIAEASADARGSDRTAVATVSDRWEHHTRSVVWAASSGSQRQRERRALVALTRLAELSEDQHAWVLEQAAAVGHWFAGVLPPPRRNEVWRDYRGHVMPSPTGVTSQSVGSLAADYDLETALVQSLLIERAGDELIGRLTLAVTRRFPIHDESWAPPAELDVRLREIGDLQFDSYDDKAVGFEVAGDGVSLSIGEHGMLTAARAEYWLHDNLWHLSAAGRRADAVTPRGSKPPRSAIPPMHGVGPCGVVAGALLYQAMIEFRMARYSSHLPSVPPKALSRAFDGAGSAVLAAGKHRLKRRREAAYRQLIETWIKRGGPDLADWFARVLGDVIVLREPAGGLLELAQQGQRTAAASASSSDLTASCDFEECELRLARYLPARAHLGRFHNASVLLHLAVPDQAEAPDTAPWRMHLVHANPSRFLLQIGAFQQTRHVIAFGADGSRHLSLCNDALLVTGVDGGCLD